jgi:hypothetical protein
MVEVLTLAQTSKIVVFFLSPQLQTGADSSRRGDFLIMAPSHLKPSSSQPNSDNSHFHYENSAPIISHTETLMN